MTVSSQVVTFQKSTGASGTTQDVGLNFIPKAIIVFSSNSTTAGAAANEYSQSIGFSDGTNHASICIHSDDGAAVGDTGRIHSNADVYIKLSETVPTTTVLARGSVAFQTNNLRFTWTVNDAVANMITVWAFGGDDITNVKVNTVDINETVNSATEDYTGLGFTPTGNGNTALFLMGVGHTANSSSSPTTTAISSFGCATSTTTSKQWSIGQCAEISADPSDTWRVSKTNGCYLGFDTAGAAESNAHLSAWISGGFRLTWTDAPSSLTVKMSYLVINGGDWDSGTLTTPTSISTDVDTSVSVNSHTIKGLMLGSISGLTNSTIYTEAIYSLGATDGITHSVHAAIDEDGQATMDGYRYHETSGGIYYGMLANGGVNDKATFDSFGTNSFRLDYPVKSINAQLVGWVVVADQNSFQQYQRSINETSISVSESLARVQVKLKPISETAVTVSETLARVQTLIKTISNESAISVSDTLARIPTYLKSISEPAINTDETLTRLPLYIRPISDEPSISTDDSIARWISISYTLAEPSISVNDSIAGALFYLRSISEPAVSVSETLVRILLAVRAISDPSISTNDTIERIATYLRLVSESAITTDESLVRIPTFVKLISNETAITTNDSIATLLAAIRTITDPSISVNDTITRIQTILKTIEEDPISVNQTLTAGLLLTISIVESRIKWYYSLLTRKIV